MKTHCTHTLENSDCSRALLCFYLGLLLVSALPNLAGVGDPQLKTDHPWYPGELACSTFERLFATQAGQYERVTGSAPKSDEEKVLTSWFWRNTHYYHGEEGAENLWGKGFTTGELRTREYWTGLFAHGFGLCGTTHSQWTAEMEYLLGHGRSRGVGVTGHNAFEAWLTGGAYETGRWALVDHDISTVIFNDEGTRLLAISEVKEDVKRWTDRENKPEKQRGWLVCGLHPNDGEGYGEFNTAEYLPGYAGVPPMVHLRRGETLRRYLEPGLEDGRTFVFWGRNYQAGGIPGPERSLTWVNQPEQMHGSRTGVPGRTGQARYGNAVYVYRPDFSNGDYREGLVLETRNMVMLEFRTPYIIAATPASTKPWGIYEPGCRNGLVLQGNLSCPVAVSVNRGHTWRDYGTFTNGMDLTDHVKGYRQYFLRFGASAKALAGSGLCITTVCQANPAILPHLKSEGAKVQFAASGQSVVSAGPTLPQAQAHGMAGGFNSPNVTLELAPPRGETPVAIYAAAHIASGNPPAPEVKYQVEYSADGGAHWEPIARDWSIPRQGIEPPDFWSQSFCYGSAQLSQPGKAVQVRFRNDGRRSYLRAEAHLVYHVAKLDATRVTFDWKDHLGTHQATRAFKPGEDTAWDIPTGRDTQTRWVEFAVVP